MPCTVTRPGGEGTHHADHDITPEAYRAIVRRAVQHARIGMITPHNNFAVAIRG